jgi:hypothetical protein
MRRKGFSVKKKIKIMTEGDLVERILLLVVMIAQI